jgi:ATP-dependent DNA helicase RecG
MSITLDTAIAALVTNKRRVSALKSLGVLTVGDALTYYPFRVTDPVPLQAVREAHVGQSMAFAATVRDVRVVPMNARRGYRLEATVDDAGFARSRQVAGGFARLTFFSHRKSYVDWLSMRLKAGTAVVVSGMPGEYMGQLQFTHPEILTVDPANLDPTNLDPASLDPAGPDLVGSALAGQARAGAIPTGKVSDAADRASAGRVSAGRVSADQISAGRASANSALKYDADTVGEALTRVCRPRPIYHASSRISSEHIHDTILGLLRMMGAPTSSPTEGDSGEQRIAAAISDVTSAAISAAPEARAASAVADSPSSAASGAAVPNASAANAASASASTASAAPSAENAPGVSAADLSGAIPDILPEEVRAAKHLMHRADAFLAIHDPDSGAGFSRAIDTLRYEEAFICQTSLLKARQHAHTSCAHPCPLEGDSLRDRFIASLPFSLTGGQRQVIDDIAVDLAREWPMQRLLQGEVGSGKTVVALAAMLQAVDAGYQAVLVAPTQVLAEQHADTIGRMMAQCAAGDAATGAPSVSDTGAATGADTVGGAANVGASADTDTAVSATAGAAAVDTVAVSAAAVATVADAPHAIPASIPVTLLTGGMKLAARRKALAEASSGRPGIIVATHAAFSKTFQAPHLALVVIDEQHRFGVEQRESLNAKTDDGTTPHLLVMTATPIPRTAAMTWFGDLDISWLTELPGGRKPIRTIVVNEADAHTMGRMFAHIRARIDAGERAYVVCPRIDEDEAPAQAAAERAPQRSASTGGEGGDAGSHDGDGGIDDPYEVFDDNGETVVRPPLHSVSQIAERLKKLPQFSGISFATLTGRDKDDVKTQVMADFDSGVTPILVSTTVIEVGVDVRQASCIVIFDADRYGLSQLHQLRGRVGRGGTNSWAFLISRAEPASPAEQRLEVIHHSLDGAEIAQADLEFRGAGDVLGDAQSGGKSSLKLLRVVKDADMIADARSHAERLLAVDPELSGEVELAGAVLDFTRGNETFLTSS